MAARAGAKKKGNDDRYKYFHKVTSFVSVTV